MQDNVKTNTSGLAFSNYEKTKARNKINAYHAATPLQLKVCPLKTAGK